MKKVAFIAAFACAVAGVGAQEDHRDSRVRTFVYPKRIVWQTGSGKTQKVEKLLERKFGQVCEGVFASKCGTGLVNKGEPAGFILDFGRELHGGVQLGMSPGGTAGARLRLRFGESVSEAMSTVGDAKHATNDHALRDFELPVPAFGSIEVGNTGFRFLRIDLVTGGEVGFEFVRAVSLLRPMDAIGGFKSSDERLNKVFDTAVRTVHLCCQEYLWDGIKRDRLVWMGDMHPETMAILNVFGAASILPESLDYMAAATPPGVWMHGMPTYTLWWIRNLAEWYRYTGDAEYVLRHADYLEKTFDHVLSGMKGGEWRAGNFLDWPTKHNDNAAWAGTQGLALVTARETAFLADVVGRAALAGKARAMASELEKLRPDPHGEKAAAAMLALSGLRDPKDMCAQVLGANGNAGLSTFYGYYMIEAMSAAGEGQRALDTVRDYWGAMLDVGATSFWEDFNLAWTNNCFRIDEMPVPGKKDIHGDYGEFCYPGFRHSLCHGWGCGPASWCINSVLGIRPLDVGCKTVEVKPSLGDLEWAEGAMALPDGRAVKVRVERRADGAVKATIDAPPGVNVVDRTSVEEPGCMSPRRTVSRVEFPQRVFTNSAGRICADFGKDAFGWLEIEAPAAGLSYFLAMGEHLKDDGTLERVSAPACVRCVGAKWRTEKTGFQRVPAPPDMRNLFTASEGSPIALPEEFGVVTPFRAVEVYECAFPVTKATIRRHVVEYPADRSESSFSCDDSRLASVWDFCRHSMYATSFLGQFVDGDRERIPYEADAYVSQLNWYAISSDCAYPRRSIEYLYDNPTWPTEFRQISILSAWTDWMWTGDAKPLERCYETLRRDKLLMDWRRSDGLLLTGGERLPNGAKNRLGLADIVDWPRSERDGFEFRDVNAVVNAFHYRDLVAMSEIAAAIGRNDDADGFRAQALETYASFQRSFFDAERGIYVDGEGARHASLHANALALAFGLVPDDRVAGVADWLEGRGMVCSVYFSQYLFEALYRAGRGEAALKLMTAEDDRSWIGMMKQGATITMEAWNRKVKPNLDWNHAWGATPLNAVSRFLLGVEPIEPGFKKISICPQIGWLKNVEAKVPTVMGPVLIRISPDRLEFDSPAPVEAAFAGVTGEFPSGRHEIVPQLRQAESP